MGRLRSGRVKRTPLTGVTSDRYKFLGLEQAEPTFGDPLVGPSSVGSNPIPVGQVYQVVSVSNSEGKRYWTPLVGFGTTVGVISVYENGFLPGGDNKFQTIHGLNFVGSGVTIETPPVDGPFEGVGIATIRIAINELKNQGNVNEILYNTSSGLASGADDFVYNDLNNYVGLGTTSPSEKLEVVGNIKVSGSVKSPEFIGNLTGTATTSTNVIGGIGSITQLRVSGVSTLGIITSGDIYSTGVVTATAFFGNLNGNATTAANLNQGNSGEIPYQVNSGITSFISVSGASNKFLKYDGSKPIWSDLTGQITSVDVKNNAVNSGQYLLFSASIGATSELNVNTNKLIFNPNTSRLGIGTTNPTTTLHVQGSIGFGAGGNINLGDSETGKSITSGVNNFFAGRFAGRDLTTGSNNVFIGYAVAFETQSGSYNTIIGYNAGAVNRGNVNFFVGPQAGLANTTGSYNTFIGQLSGVSNTIGSRNNFIGYLSGSCNTTGSCNNFFGPHAGNFNVSGSGNNFFGSGAGWGNISGVNNNFLGDNNGSANAAGSNNNFFGSYSGTNNTVGNYNNFFGKASGHCNTTGSCNIFIGRCAGFANTSGSGNIVIGYNRDAPILNGSNQLVIGAGTGDWIVGNSSYNVGIGTTNPTSKLHVNGGALITGISTLGTVRISSGIITATSGIVTYYGDGRYLENVVGVTTDAVNVIGGIASVTSLRVSGVSTLGTVQISSGIVTATSGIVTYYGDGRYLENVVGVTTDAVNVIGGIADITSLNVSGISTLGTVLVSSGIITATSGIVTYYGDGRYLQNIVGTTTNAAFATTSLNVVGGISSVTSLKVGSNDGDVITTTSTFVGIGTKTPTQQLHVQGSLRIIGGIYDSNNNVGSAGSVLSSTGSGISWIPAPTGGTQADSYWVQSTPSSVGIYTGSNVGIGTTAARSKLDVVGNVLVSGITTLGTVRITSGIITAASGVVTYYGDGSNLTGVTGTGKIGINSNGVVVGVGITLINFAGAGVSSITANNTLGIATVTLSSTTTTVVGSSSTILNDTTTNSTLYPTFVNATTGTASTIRVSSSKLQFNPSTGNFSATQFTSLSDESQKINIEPIQNSIDIVSQLNGVKFNWRENNRPSYGLIAQDVEKVIPELVETQENGLKSVNYSNMIALLIEAIKVQELRIQELESRHNA